MLPLNRYCHKAKDENEKTRRKRGTGGECEIVDVGENPEEIRRAPARGDCSYEHLRVCANTYMRVVERGRLKQSFLDGKGLTHTWRRDMSLIARSSGEFRSIMVSKDPG
ncbi:hypothetical protein DY000_02033840 [Brassica cretica]|uniref:Uncharacterized protein n=1 Tax=Brassica cretica TaxID=69181 RepID=A0ABQ7DPQ4_BRACR|nr:hypothetical protein DY000_02033840 [Brassica cretica]